MSANLKSVPPNGLEPWTVGNTGYIRPSLSQRNEVRA